MILCSKTWRALVAGMFLLLASLQPGLAAAAGNGAGSAVSTEAGHDHDGAGSHDHGDQAGAHMDRDQQDGDHHRTAGMDLCCEMHCVMNQAMPASTLLMQAPLSGRVYADFTHAVPDGQVYSVIKPPRTTS